MSAEKAANPKKKTQQHVLLKSRTVGYFCGKCKLYGQDPSAIRPLPCVEIVFNSDDEAESPKPKHADLRKKTKLLRDLQEETLYLEQLLEMKKKEVMDERKRELARVKAAAIQAIESQEDGKPSKPSKPGCMDNVETQLVASPCLSPPKPRKLVLPSPTPAESESITPTERESPMSDGTRLQLEEAGRKRPLPDSTDGASKKPCLLKSNELAVANLATPPPPGVGGGASSDLGAEEPGLPAGRLEKASSHDDAVAYMSPKEQTAAINAAKKAKTSGHDDEDEDPHGDDEEAEDDDGEEQSGGGKTGKAKGAEATGDPEPVDGKDETAAKPLKLPKSRKTAEVEAQELPQSGKTGKGARRVPKRGADEAAGPEADDAAKPRGRGKRVAWNKEIAQASSAEEKAEIEKRFAKSRKSTAYHTTLAKWLKAGMTKDKAIEKAKQAYKDT
ncbi:unnamed protein product, partial [Symbiodinium sp. CCMP2456]